MRPCKISMRSFFELTLWNPVLKRELLAGLRSPRLRWILLLYLLAPFVMIVMEWPDGQLYHGGSHLAVQVWSRFKNTQICLIILLTPIFAAYIVSAEFEQQTADFLWTTMIPPWLIILSKMAAVVLLSFGLQIASLPALSTVFFLGGVDSRQIQEGYFALLCITLCATAIAVYFSALIRKGHIALFCSYNCLWLVAVFVAVGIFRSGGIGNRFGPYLFLLIVSVVFGFLACLAGNRPVGEKARANFKPIEDPAWLAQRRRTWPYYLVDPMRRLPPISDTGHVVAEQETHIHPLHRSAWGYRCAYLIALLSIPVIGSAIYDRGYSTGFYQVVWWMTFLIAGIWTLLLHAISMTMDQQMGTLDGLRLTPITGDQFLEGKWLASVRMRWIILLGGVTMVALIGFIGSSPLFFSLRGRFERGNGFLRVQNVVMYILH